MWAYAIWSEGQGMPQPIAHRRRAPRHEPEPKIVQVAAVYCEALGLWLWNACGRSRGDHDLRTIHSVVGSLDVERRNPKALPRNTWYSLNFAQSDSLTLDCHVRQVFMRCAFCQADAIDVSAFYSGVLWSGLVCVTRRKCRTRLVVLRLPSDTRGVKLLSLAT